MALEPGEFQSLLAAAAPLYCTPRRGQRGSQGSVQPAGWPDPRRVSQGSEPTREARCGLPGESPSGNAARSSLPAAGPGALWLFSGSRAARLSVCVCVVERGCAGRGGACLREGLAAAPARTDSPGAARAAPHTEPLASPLTPTPPTPLSSHPPPLGPFQAL